MTDVALAVDLGGTNLRMAAVAKDGTILAHARTASDRGGTPGDLLNALAELAAECGCAAGTESPVIGMGVGVPANFDKDGVLTHVTNLPKLTGMNLRAELSAKFGVPVILENDATAATIGENWIGASRDVKDSIMLTLGTGVGGGIIINNEPFRGIDGTAGRLGHINVEPEGHPCGCGSRGCIEQYASATAIVRMAREAGLDAKTSKDVYDLWLADPQSKSGELAEAVFQKMGRYLGITLASLINALNPEMIVLGGGVATGLDAFIEHVNVEIEARAFHEPAKRARILKGTLTDNAGILGAARSAFEAV
ncbi:MAG: ROK family protein [Pyrinomonadaceae bacterium]